MGTSQSHSSPRTAAWGTVRKLYTQGADAAKVASAIANAVPEASIQAATREPLCGMGSAITAAVSADADQPTAELVSGMDESPEIGHDTLASIARAAALRTVQMIDPQDVAAQPLLAEQVYAAEYLAAFFEYLVERDIHDHVGSEALPTLAAASALCDKVALEARNSVSTHVESLAREQLATANRSQLVAALMMGALARLRGMSSVGS